VPGDNKRGCGFWHTSGGVDPYHGTSSPLIVGEPVVRSRDVGVRLEQKVEIKRVDMDYFEAAETE
jgi:hypothetical protein